MVKGNAVAAYTTAKTTRLLSKNASPNTFFNQISPSFNIKKIGTTIQFTLINKPAINAVFKNLLPLNLNLDKQQAAGNATINKIINAKVFPISAKEETGIDILSAYIVNLFANKEIDFNDEVYISNERDKVSLDNAKESLRLVIRSIEDGMPEDFYTIDLMNAYTELGKVIGESVEDDLVNEIFGKFCMGKQAGK